MPFKASDIMEYVKSANLKGEVEIMGDDRFSWDLDGICLEILVNDGETTVLYSRRKNIFFEIGHMHEFNSDVIDFIRDVNNEDNRVHVTASFWGSSFGIEHKTEKKKKSWLFVRHYYSRL